MSCGSAGTHGTCWAKEVCGSGEQDGKNNRLHCAQQRQPDNCSWGKGRTSKGYFSEKAGLSEALHSLGCFAQVQAHRLT